MKKYCKEVGDLYPTRMRKGIIADQQEPPNGSTSNLVCPVLLILANLLDHLPECFAFNPPGGRASDKYAVRLSGYQCSSCVPVI